MIAVLRGWAIPPCAFTHPGHALASRDRQNALRLSCKMFKGAVFIWKIAVSVQQVLKALDSD